MGEGGSLQVVGQFCCLGEVLFCEVAETAVRSRIDGANRKCRIQSAGSRKVSVRNRENLSCECVRPVMLLGAETWPTNKELERMAWKSECRMLKYKGYTKYEYGLSNEEAIKRCSVEGVLRVLRKQRWRWYEEA